jgi:hypothetical protein
MREEEAMSPAPNDRVYRISPRRRAVLWCVFGPFALLALGLSFATDHSSREAGVVVFLVIGAMLVLWEWLVRRTMLVLTDTGVRLEQLGMRLAAPWTDVETLCLTRGREGFVVSVPIASGGAARLAALRGIGTSGVPLYGTEQRDLMSERRWIPIEPFAWHVRHGGLATEVARLAPHVRVLPDARGPGWPRVERRDVLAALITLVLLAAAVALALGAAGPAETWIVTVLQCVCSPLLTLSSAASVRSAVHNRSLLLAVLFGALTLVMAGWVVVAWSDLAALVDSA